MEKEFSASVQSAMLVIAPLASSLALARLDLREQPDDLPSRIRVHRQEVDDVGPVVASLVAVAHQARGDRVAVGLIADQDAAEVVASLRIWGREERTEVGIRHDESLCLSHQTGLEGV